MAVRRRVGQRVSASSVEDRLGTEDSSAAAGIGETITAVLVPAMYS